MIYDSRTYRMLLVSASDGFNASFETRLPKSSYYLLNVADTVERAGRMVRLENYDFIVINSPLPDGKGLELAEALGRRKDCVCLFISKQDEFESAYSRLVRQGVFTLSKPISSTVLDYAFKWMESAREHVRSRRDELESVESKLEKKRTIARAKEVLISRQNMSEEEAHRFIAIEAMDRCVSKLEIAERILRDTEKNDMM